MDLDFFVCSLENRIENWLLEMWAWRMDWWHDEESLPSRTGPSAPSSSRAVIAWIMSNRPNVFCRSSEEPSPRCCPATERRAIITIIIIIRSITTTSYSRRAIHQTAPPTSGNIYLETMANLLFSFFFGIHHISLFLIKHCRHFLRKSIRAAKSLQVI